MAKYESPFGPISGTIGELVFYTSGGQQLVRRRPTRKPKMYPHQLEQQARFGLVNKFIKSMRGLFQYTFKPSDGHTARTNAFRNVYRHLHSDGSRLSFDFENMQISKGTLHPVESPKAELKGTKLVFSWIDNSRADQSNATDKSILVVYCPDLIKSWYQLEGSSRNEGSDLIDVELFKGYTVETWMAFISEDMKEVCDSLYTGRFEIPKEVPRK